MRKNVMVMLCMLFALSSCNKENLEMDGDASLTFVAEPLLVKDAVPDVYAEDGCLVLKNLQVRDSIAEMLYDMTDEERVAWEKSWGFESAMTHFAPYFEKYDNVASEEECERFVRDYASVLQITRDKEGLVEVEYPFNAQGNESVVNKDGRVRIGNALYIYKDNRRIVVHKATPEKVAKYQNATMASNQDLVEVIYNAGVPMTRAGSVAADINLASSGGYQQNAKKKKYRWDLLYTCEREIVNESQCRIVSTLKLEQKAKRKYLGGWHEYKTTYHVSGNSYIRISYGKTETCRPESSKDQSRERKNGTAFTLCKFVSKDLFSINANITQARVGMLIYIKHRPDYADWLITSVNKTPGSSTNYVEVPVKMKYN